MTGELLGVLSQLVFSFHCLKCPRCFKVSCLSLFIVPELGETPIHAKEGGHNVVRAPSK